MAQRVTNAMMINTFNRNLYRNAAKMERFQTQLATNRKIVRLSDDPVGVIKSLNARSRLAGIEQYQRNIQDAQSWLTQSESSVTELNTILKRVYELSVSLSNEVKTPEDRQAASYELKELLDQVITLGNATLGDKYLFGGYNVTKAPMAVDAVSGEMTFNGFSLYDPADLASVQALDEIISYEIGFGTDLPVSTSGVRFMGLGEDNVYHQIKEFYEKASSAEMEDLKPFIGIFQRLQGNALALSAEIGGRQNRLELMTARFEQDFINYTQMKSDVEDLDQAEAIMYFSMAEAVYRAALSVGGRILQPTLADFLR
ncbi:MAG: flagellar hook-associated protein FlgL [Oscillospiraceae bacterium]|jgi:flagellar hook-associated protein 3 FlgL|nr:flagellar hook-associated protein FlgL [Oscillospiraceae bacterium]